MWPAARVYNKQTYKYHIDKMFAECPDFGVYLRTYHSLLWYRSGFNTDIKVDHINNHLAEWFNNWRRDIEDLPVHELMDTLRIRIMNIFNTRRALSNKLHGDKLPTVVQQVVRGSRGLGHLHVVNASNYSAEVMDTDKKRRHVVKIDIHECTCLRWQATELEPDGEGTPQQSLLPVPKLMKRGRASAIPRSPKRPRKIHKPLKNHKPLKKHKQLSWRLMV